jgi:hypothetical protein
MKKSYLGDSVKNHQKFSMSLAALILLTINIRTQAQTHLYLGTNAG